jgi:methylated-DNA-protein-cysteine methyltransferase-like protein
MPGETKQRESRWQAFYRVVRRVPKGRVATYGQVAELAGFPRYARQVGYALSALRSSKDGKVPWQRVINAQGEVSQRSAPDGDRLQRAILESEGIVFTSRGRVDLDRYGWRPRRR